MKQAVLLLTIVAITITSYGQTFFTRNGKISFFSTTPAQDITAENNEVVSSLDITKAELSFQALIKGFIFPKALMQEHFNNPQYLNSDAFPQSSFKGTITNAKELNLAKDGIYKAKVQGNLTLHGITKPLTTEGTITVAKGVVNAKSVFKINREDYGIAVPAYAGNKIAKEIELTIDCTYTGKK